MFGKKVTSTPAKDNLGWLNPEELNGLKQIVGVFEHFAIQLKFSDEDCNTLLQRLHSQSAITGYQHNEKAQLEEKFKDAYTAIYKKLTSTSDIPKISLLDWSKNIASPVIIDDPNSEPPELVPAAIESPLKQRENKILDRLAATILTAIVNKDESDNVRGIAPKVDAKDLKLLSDLCGEGTLQEAEVFAEFILKSSVTEEIDKVNEIYLQKLPQDDKGLLHTMLTKSWLARKENIYKKQALKAILMINGPKDTEVETDLETALQVGIQKTNDLFRVSLDTTKLLSPRTPADETNYDCNKSIFMLIVNDSNFPALDTTHVKLWQAQQNLKLHDQEVTQTLQKISALAAIRKINRTTTALVSIQALDSALQAEIDITNTKFNSALKINHILTLTTAAGESNSDFAEKIGGKILIGIAMTLKKPTKDQVVLVHEISQLGMPDPELTKLLQTKAAEINKQVLTSYKNRLQAMWGPWRVGVAAKVQVLDKLIQETETETETGTPTDADTKVLKTYRSYNPFIKSSPQGTHVKTTEYEKTFEDQIVVLKISSSPR